jgi:hypothetical protein
MVFALHKRELFQKTKFNSDRIGEYNFIRKTPNFLLLLEIDIAVLSFMFHTSEYSKFIHIGIRQRCLINIFFRAKWFFRASKNLNMS